MSHLQLLFDNDLHEFGVTFLKLCCDFGLIFSDSILKLILKHVFFDAGDVIARFKGGNVKFIIIIKGLVKIQRGVRIDRVLLFWGIGYFSQFEDLRFVNID